MIETCDMMERSSGLGQMQPIYFVKHFISISGVEHTMYRPN